MEIPRFVPPHCRDAPWGVSSARERVNGPFQKTSDNPLTGCGLWKDIAAARRPTGRLYGGGEEWISAQAPAPAFPKSAPEPRGSPPKAETPAPPAPERPRDWQSTPPRPPPAPLH